MRISISYNDFNCKPYSHVRIQDAPHAMPRTASMEPMRLTSDSFEFILRLEKKLRQFR